jgi:hypothetical protein
VLDTVGETIRERNQIRRQVKALAAVLLTIGGLWLRKAITIQF